MKRLLLLLLLTILVACTPAADPILPNLPSDTTVPRVPGMEEAFSTNYRDDLIYYEFGGRGQAIVLLHSLEPGADSFNNWRNNTKALLDSGYSVYALDLFGYGRSGRDARRLTSSYYLGFLTAFLEALETEPVVLMASGRSGAYAIDIAANRPDLVAGLILAAPTGYSVFGDDLEAETKFNGLVTGGGLFRADAYRARSSIGGVDRFLRDAYFNPEAINPEVRASYYNNLQATSSDWLVYSFESGSLNLSIDRVWPSVRQPTLMLWGLENSIIPVESAEAFLNASPKVELKVLNGARMAMQDERGLAFNAFVIEFLLRNFPAFK